MNLPKIYPITDTRLSALSHVEQVEQLIAGGANFIQLREKRTAPKDFHIEADRVLQIARAKGAKIIINDRVDVALALNADGVHLGQDDLPPEAARKILGENAIIGYSTHSVAQAVEAVKMPVDYIAVGPIYATQTKENPDEIVGLGGLEKVRAAIGDFPLVAIGGINRGNLGEVFAHGADSCAVISDLFTKDRSLSATMKYLLDLASAF